MKKSVLTLFLMSTCIGTGTNDTSKYISEMDNVYLEMATLSEGVIIDGVLEGEVPRAAVLDTQYFKNKTIRLFEIYNTDTTCVIPYTNYVYIVDFFNEFKTGDKIRYDDFVLFRPFNSFRKDSDTFFEWKDSTYRYYWLEGGYIRKRDAKRVMDESIVIVDEFETYEEDEEDFEKV